MPLTVGDLLELPGLGLTLVAGKEGLGRPIRWAHTSELPDPTRWLSGGELLLTTGLGLKGSPAAQRAYLNRLDKAGLAGLGFGLGLGFESVPTPILRAADRAAFPVVEVPYPVPFIAITEAVSSALTRERTHELELSAEIHDRLARLVVDGAGPADILEEAVTIAGGWAYLFDVRGNVVAASSRDDVRAEPSQAVWDDVGRHLFSGDGTASSSSHQPRGSVVSYAVTGATGPEGVVAFGKAGRLGPTDRLVVRHAVTVLGLLLASRRTVAEAERRIAGDVLIEGIEGHLERPQLERRLELAGFPPLQPVAVLVVEPDERGDVAAAATSFEDVLVRSASRHRVAVVSGAPVAVVGAADAEQVAAEWAKGLSDGRGAGPRLGVGESVHPGELRRSYLSANLALKAGPEALPVVTQRHIGAYGLLLHQDSPAVLESFVTSVIGPLRERDRERGSDLLPSVRVFVESGGRWEEGAEALGVHRHTLRYRINQAQELLERDLFSAQDRMEIWLACKALDLLETRPRP